jgi:hypothetical protein
MLRYIVVLLLLSDILCVAYVYRNYSDLVYALISSAKLI